MPVLDQHPNLTDLYRVIAKVPAYPITAQRVVGMAIKLHAPQEVIDFYRAFPSDEIFENRDDITARTEQLEMMDFDDDLSYESELLKPGE